MHIRNIKSGSKELGAGRTGDKVRRTKECHVTGERWKERGRLICFGWLQQEAQEKRVIWREIRESFGGIIVLTSRHDTGKGAPSKLAC